jgi:hypothetical protein
MMSNNPRDIITGVKEAVAREVGSLSPDANIVVTEYFNHSYMPDMVLEWNDAGRRDVRPIYLRNSLRPSVTEEEVRTLARRDPVVLSLTALTDPGPRFNLLREQAREAGRVLVTDVVSLADMTTPLDAGQYNRADHGPPLLRLVQANLLKGGRGVITSQDAERLARSAAATVDGSGLTDQFLASFQESADEMFAPDAALRLRRSAELLRFGLSNEVIEAGSLSTGELSDVELRVLVPYLLVDETARANLRLWNHIGSMMSLERLEEMGGALVGVDVSVLVVPNVEAWTAKRAQLVINNSFEGAQDTTDTAEDEDPATRTVSDAVDSMPNTGAPFWYVSNRMLTADAGPWRLLVATDARRLKGRSESAAADWDDISSMLNGFALDAVDLRSISRRIFVGATGSGDVSSDVALIRGTMQDNFQVTEVRVRRIGDDQSMASINVDFTEMTATGHRVSIASLVKAAELLGRRRSPDFSGLIGGTAAPGTGAAS